MEPATVYLLGALMMMANGGVLGLMHRDFPPSLRPSAVSWRIGTLLHACGCTMFMVQDSLPHSFILPLANGLVMGGFTCYWGALRQFYGVPRTLVQLAPVTVGVLGVYWFADVSPNPLGRLVVVSLVWVALLGVCIYTLLQQSRRDRAWSRQVMAGTFVALLVSILFRLGWFLTMGMPDDYSGLDGSLWINMASPVVLSIMPVIGTTAFLLMCSERIRRQWERAASTDYLTGLANRRTLADAGARRFERARGQNRGFGLGVIDIDHFKSINDRFGHDVGDAALKHVAAKLEMACREQELPARQGGEEFVVLFDDVSGDTALAAGERLRKAVADAPFTSGALMLPITISIGVAVRLPEDTEFDCVLRRADAALYAAKQGGRNRVECAAPNMRMPAQTAGAAV
ncbi:GGDEF domain-containing protein [Pseudoduganella ginsengisoli]|uniref:diguanylate cyclase n=1 Tax=Pseudoduganella ginsengisoli TaxID=1462440 RepID=A0A6L6PYI1_9BURK|nr:sensor domain-containing diguanylate cyclase [Pseudoduganella ginsengisoli]MTW02316.1 diguanylate cyclase [Pseudoduganella ginsengisoli]